jgi:hypothetical protein
MLEQSMQISSDMTRPILVSVGTMIDKAVYNAVLRVKNEVTKMLVQEQFWKTTISKW